MKYLINYVNIANDVIMEGDLLEGLQSNGAVNHSRVQLIPAARRAVYYSLLNTQESSLDLLKFLKCCREIQFDPGERKKANWGYSGVGNGAKFCSSTRHCDDITEAHDEEEEEECENSFHDIHDEISPTGDNKGITGLLEKYITQGAQSITTFEKAY